MKVVIGVDGSKRCYEAVEYCSRLLNPDEDTVVFYFSSPHPDGNAANTLGTAAEGKNGLAKEILDHAISQLAPGLQPNAKTIEGTKKPAEGLLAVVENERADLLVVGAQDVSKAAPFYIGGNTSAVAHRATIPVLAFRPCSQNNERPFRICVACDEGRWQYAVGEAARLNWPANAEMILFHAVETEEVSSIAEARSTDPYLERLQERHRLWIESSRDAGGEELSAFGASIERPTFKVVRGGAIDEIVRLVKADEIDLLIVGARRLGRVERFMGSTTEALLMRSPCSVFVVHEPRPV